MDLKEDVVYPLYLGTKRQTERLSSLVIYRSGGWPWRQEWRKGQAWLVVIDKSSECRAADRYPSTFTSLAAELNSCLSLTRRLLTGSGSCVCRWRSLVIQRSLAVSNYRLPLVSKGSPLIAASTTQWQGQISAMEETTILIPPTQPGRSSKQREDRRRRERGYTKTHSRRAGRIPAKR